MLITLVGPNIPGNQGATFHVHAAGCADLQKHHYARMTEKYDLESASFRDLVEDTYQDQLAENEGTDWGTWLTYEDEFRLFPCASSLPRESSQDTTIENKETKS